MSILLYIFFVLIAVFCSTDENPRLTHVIMPFHPRQLESVKDNLKLWSKQFPCKNDSTRPEIGFIFYVSSSKKEIPDLEAFELELYEASIIGMNCFKFFSIEYAGLIGTEDGYLLGSRLMFERMIKKEISFGPIEPSHIFYMEPDCQPIRPDWLKSLNILIIIPNEKFWIKGSVFRGPKGVIRNNNIHNYIHINGNALYNLSDNGLRDFYFNVVRRVIKSNLRDNGAYDMDIFRVLLWRNAIYTSKFLHMFHFSNFIQNQWHSNYSLREIMETSPDTFFIHGGEAI